MTAPGIVTGGNSETQPSLFRSPATGTPTRQGVFGKYPGATPKFALNAGGRDAEYTDTMARLFIAVPPGEVESILNTVSPEARPLAQVLLAGGSSGGGGGTGFIDFLLTSATEDFQEKAQIVDTLTDNYVAFYAGQVPPVFQYSGTVLNTYQDDQRVWLLRIYREILRGTRLATRNLVANLRYDSFLVTGYLESLRLTLNGDTGRTAGDFVFNMRVQRMTVLTPALAAPTVSTTPAVSSSLLGSLQTASAADTERVAAVTPDTPESASSRPAADPQEPASPSAEDVASLQSQGVPPEQINQSIADANAAAVADGQTQGPDTQAREEAHQASLRGADRMSRAVSSTRTTRTPARTAAQRRRQAARTAGGSSAVMSVPEYDADGNIIGYAEQYPPVNPANMSSDGNGGMTNAYGQNTAFLYTSQMTTATSAGLSYSTEDAVPPMIARSGQRTRGRPVDVIPEFLRR